MPVIKIEFDDGKVEKEEVLALSKAVQKIVSDTTKIEDVSVFANSSQIKVKIAPIEIFVQMSAHKIDNVDKLLEEIGAKLSMWKKKNSFKHPINLTLDPRQWKFKIGI